MLIYTLAAAGILTATYSAILSLFYKALSDRALRCGW